MRPSAPAALRPRATLRQRLRPAGSALLGAALAAAFGFLAFSGTAPSASPDQAVTILVDPLNGHDEAGGTKHSGGPVATLDHALDIVAAVRARKPSVPIMVALGSGLFRLDHAIAIRAQHGGTAAAPLVIRGAADGSTRLTGSLLLTPLPDPLPASLAARLPEAARDHVRLYRLPAATLEPPAIQGLSLLRHRPTTVALEVYDDQGPLVPARWPPEGWAKVAAGPAGPGEPRFAIDSARLQRWQGEPDLWAEGFWHWNWLFEALPVAGLDAASREIRLPQNPFDGIRAGARFRISHALSELDRPGEWWRDRADGLLVAWPRSADGRLEVATTTTLLDIEHAAHIRLENLSLEHARGDLVLVQDARDVVLRRSRLSWAAGRGAVFEDVRDGGVEDCELTGLGGAALRMVGGDRPSLTSGGLFVRRSRFSHFARLILTQQPAIYVEGVGARIEQNLFHDAGASAVLMAGNDIRFAGNELTRLLAGVDDIGAVYAGRDWTARGNVIEENFFHDIHADPGLQDKGVLLDDMASGFAIRRNLFLRVDQPVFIGGGRDNAVTGNLFVDSSPAIHVDSRLQTWQGRLLTDPASDFLAAFRAMPVDSPLWRRRYPGLSGLLSDEPALAKNNVLTGNTFVQSEPFDFSDGGQRAPQIIADNVGPDGLHLKSGADLRQRARDSTDPGAFADLLDRDGRAVGLDLRQALGRTAP